MMSKDVESAKAVQKKKKKAKAMNIIFDNVKGC